MSLRVGQKVVCLRDCWNIVPDHLRDVSVQLPRAGIEYIVRSVKFDAIDGECIRLLWLSLPSHPSAEEPAFGVIGRDGIANFKPVVETDISVFTAMLAPKKRKATRKLENV